MDQVKKDSKILLDFFPKRHWLKNVSQIKDLILLSLGQAGMTRDMLHRPLKSANHIISAMTKNRRTTVPHQNNSSDKKKRKRENDI